MRSNHINIFIVFYFRKNYTAIPCLCLVSPITEPNHSTKFKPKISLFPCIESTVIAPLTTCTEKPGTTISQPNKFCDLNVGYQLLNSYTYLEIGKREDSLGMQQIQGRKKPSKSIAIQRWLSVACNSCTVPCLSWQTWTKLIMANKQGCDKNSMVPYFISRVRFRLWGS